jgi:hypothetical protein
MKLAHSTVVMYALGVVSAMAAACAYPSYWLTACNDPGGACSAYTSGAPIFCASSPGSDCIPYQGPIYTYVTQYGPANSQCENGNCMVDVTSGGYTWWDDEQMRQAVNDPNCG